MDVGIQLWHPMARDEEGCQVEQIHKYFVAVTAGMDMETTLNKLTFI